MDQFILLGDSITQASFSEAGAPFGPRLLNDYIRKLDVVNRGFSGYNTTQLLKKLPQIIPSPQTARVRVLCIFMGANDACLPNTPGPKQDVSLDQYSQNLIDIVRSPAVQAHEDVRVVFITPPPIHEGMCFEQDKAKFGAELMKEPRRTAASTKSYADACKRVASLMNAPVVDLWTAILRDARYDVQKSMPGSLAEEAWWNERLRPYLSDGLHLTSAAYAVLYRELTKTIDETWPDLIPDNMKPVLPNWDDEAAWK